MASTFQFLENAIEDWTSLIFDGAESNDGLNITLDTLGLATNHAGGNAIAGFLDGGVYLDDSWNSTSGSIFSGLISNLVRFILIDEITDTKMNHSKKV